MVATKISEIGPHYAPYIYFTVTGPNPQTQSLQFYVHEDELTQESYDWDGLGDPSIYYAVRSIMAAAVVVDDVEATYAALDTALTGRDFAIMPMLDESSLQSLAVGGRIDLASHVVDPPVRTLQDHKHFLKRLEQAKKKADKR